ncbi:hypothetical protein N0V88_006681 [Collariella sp. IMI 366227]|nr:hypothetical protein N0V88_006681 [Collariella sp. IMI 366227]
MAARWGSFLSQAVAGVEARLDNMLAEGEGGPEQQQQKETRPATPASPSKQSPGPSRTASAARTNDRLQERLARALAAKSAGRPSTPVQGSPRQSLEATGRNSTDSIDRSSPTVKEYAKEAPSPRASQDIVRTSQDSVRNSQDIARNSQEGVAKEVEKRAPANGKPKSEQQAEEVNGGKELNRPTASTEEPALEPDTKTTSDDVTIEEQAKGSNNTLEDAKLQQQEEIHGYIERIDALEAKLQFLAREAGDSARKAALEAPAGSLEKKLAEKDQQIAQLMEEGKNLASSDHKQRAIVKKLRTTLAENEKELNAFRAAKEKSDRELDNLRSRASRADELEKSNDSLQKSLDQTQKELNNLRPDIRFKDSTIAELRAQLRQATEHADAATAKANEQGREQDRRKIADLEEAVAALKVEKNLVADRGKAQATDLREKAERASERARALELELKAEVQVMEGKLEAMRMRAEEASSGAAGDSQAKLLRQVETLQTQYSIASDNWQGIETTLLARITGLERERDEALQRESEMRRKAREAAVRAKRHEEELEEAKTKIPTIQEDVKTYQAQLDALKRRAEEAESALAKAKADFEKQKQSWEAEKEERQLLINNAPERPRSWLEGLPGGSFLKPESRPASPQLTFPQRTFSTDFLGISTLTSKARKASGPSATTSEAGASGLVGLGLTTEPRLPYSRRPSAQPPSRPTINSNPGGGSSSGGLFSPLALQPHLRSPASSPLDREVQRGEDAFESGAEMTSSPKQQSTQQAHDLISLVERMSAAIRRLESEKVAGKEELARISRQRDEARAEIVVEGGKIALRKVEGLEREVGEVKERYETTLELLGEKSEEVEELRADVEDVKAMYRDLVERTIK